MGAGFERDIERGASGTITCLFERKRFGMGTSAGLCPSPAYDNAVPDGKGAYSRVGPAQWAGPGGKARRCGHPSRVVIHRLQPQHPAA